MAKKKDIVNEIKGSIGDFVIYKRYGKTFLRQRPKTMNHPNSDAQMEQRHKFSQSNTLAKSYRAAVGHVSLETDEPKSPYNALLGLIRRTGFKGNYPDITWDWNRIQFSEGTLPLPDSLIITKKDNLVQVTWNPLASNKLGTLYLIAVHADSLGVRCVYDDSNSGLLSMTFAEGEHYFVFKEFLAGEQTKKSTTARLLGADLNDTVPVLEPILDSKQKSDVLVVTDTDSEDVADISFNPEEFESIEASSVSEKEISFNPDVFEGAGDRVELPNSQEEMGISEAFISDNSSELDSDIASKPIELELTESALDSVVPFNSDEMEMDVLAEEEEDISFNPEEFESDPVAHESDEVVETTDITVEETVLPEEKIEVKEDSSPKKEKAKSPKKSADKPAEKAKEDVGPAQLSLF